MGKKKIKRYTLKNLKKRNKKIHVEEVSLGEGGRELKDGSQAL